MKVIDVCLSKSTACYVLFIYFDNGLRGHLDMSPDFYRCHPSYVRFVTQSGFVARPKPLKGFSSLPFSVDSYGHLLIKLPTCCGYVSVRSKWLSTGSFHRYCIVDIDDFISSLYIFT